ncbi:hypothetical protein ACP4OV_003782 [Aristida adscensionis]
MPLVVSFALLLSLSITAGSAMTDTITVGQALGVDDKLISRNSRYALGFFELGNIRKSSGTQNTTKWYLGIWFNKVPKFTPAWVANRDDPIKNPTSLELTISPDGNLVILSGSNKSVVWSTRANITHHNTTAILLDNGNFNLHSATNSSNVLWQSFDYPTDTLFPGAKLGWDKVTGLNRRLVSWKNSADPATGLYCQELDPSGVNQSLLTQKNTLIPYWSSGAWNGRYFPSLPETLIHANYFTFVDNDKEKYFAYTLPADEEEAVVVRQALDISGQLKTFVWIEGSQDWTSSFTSPRSQCDVYAICGPFTICDDNALISCNCMTGFTVASPKDWELNDRSSGCLRNTPLDCASHNKTSSTDKFYTMSCVSMPQNSYNTEDARSAGDCAKFCLNNCSCTAYSYGNDGCSLWHNELLNIRQHQCSGPTTANGKTVHLRLAAKDVHYLKSNRRGLVIGVATGASIVALCLLTLTLLQIIWRNKRKHSGHILNNDPGCNIIVAFRYADLQRATKGFSEKLGGGAFGSVFKGCLSGSVAIAVKQLDHARQGEKQFRAEVSSIGIIQHTNLVKLIGFCCEGEKRLLVYEHMPNRSLDAHLFQSNGKTLNWSVRYKIAMGVARGLAYLHGSCRDCIIHCDIKPENILLDDLFIPKIADFGMAKFMGRDFSRVLTTMRGTIGYLAPEWISGVAITPKIDVYAYGMVLLELVSGKRNSCASSSSGSDHHIYFPVHVAHRVLEGDVRSLLDDKLYGDVDLKEVETVCKVACWCIQDSEYDRPTMSEVIQIFEGLVEMNMPPMPRLLQAIAESSNSTCSWS